MKPSVQEGWAVKWRSGPNNVDKKVIKHLIWPDGCEQVAWTARHPVWFRTRKLALAWRDRHYGDLAARPDLRTYPHDWKPPVVVRATLAVQEVKRAEPQRSRRKRRGARNPNSACASH